MAKSRVRRRGRSVFAALLAGFLIVAFSIIARRSMGIAATPTLRRLDRLRVQLESERVRVRGEIRDASSRERLGPVAERLGMRVPSDRQLRILPRSQGVRAAP